jgi:hypothetical protein
MASICKKSKNGSTTEIKNNYSMLTLKNLYGKIISEKYARYGTEKIEDEERRIALDQMRNNTLSSDDLYKIYELEYKLFMLSIQKRKGGQWLGDTAYLKETQWRSELQQRLTHCIQRLFNVMLGWAKYEELVYIIPEKMGADEWERRLAQRAEQEKAKLRGRANDPQMQLPFPKTVKKKSSYDTRTYDVPAPEDHHNPEAINMAQIEKMEKDAYFQEVWSSVEPYKTVEKTIRDLSRGVDPNNISAAIVLFHKALTTAHNNGTMLEYAIDGMDSFSAKKYLDELTNGKFIPKWNQDLAQMGIVQDGRNKLQEAQMMRHPTPEQLAMVLGDNDPQHTSSTQPKQGR